MSMDWSGIIQKYGWTQEQVGSEPFTPLGQQVTTLRASGGAVAKVSTTVGTAVEYGAIKVSFTVSMECPQTESAINMAAECVYWKALELVNNGARHLGMPEMGPRSG